MWPSPVGGYLPGTRYFEKTGFCRIRPRKAIEEFPNPQTVKQLKTFLGLMSNYMRSIPMFSQLAFPLNKLLKRILHMNGLMSRNKQKQNDFSVNFEISRLESQIYPDDGCQQWGRGGGSFSRWDREISSYSFCQPFPKHGREKIQCYRKWTSSHRMGNAVFQAVPVRNKIYRRNRSQTPPWIKSVKDSGSRWLKWKINLEEYDYDTVFKMGATNTNADALSRVSSLVADKGKRQQITDKETKATTLYEYHDSPVGGHRGMN